jgi:signal transduction histidine kinase/ligand-binding sensor domain-containing protein/DNA-binding response OmpR family regulator
MLILSIGFAYSQTEQYKFRYLTTEDGLPTNFCYSVIKDSQGFIWISTRAGLCRYDGYNVKVYQYNPTDSSSISDNSLGGTKSMVVDHNGTLWVSTYRSVNKYDPITDSFKRYQYDPDDPGSINSEWIYCLFIDRSGTLWVGTGKNGGLNRYMPENDQFIAYTQNSGDSIWQISSIFSLYEDCDGIFWVGSRGLYQFDRGKETFKQINYTPTLPDPANPVLFSYINEDIDSTLFIGTQFGYLTYDKLNNELIPFEPLYDECKSFISLDILPEPGNENQSLWMIAWGLHLFNKHTHSLTLIPYDPKDPNSISGELLNSFYKDETGMIWVPCEIGVNIMTRDQIEKHPEYSDKHVEPNTFLEDSEGHLWIGASSLVHFDKEMKLVKEYGFPDNKEEDHITIWIQNIFEDAEKNLWVGTQLNGLYLLEKGKDELVRCTLLPSDPFEIYDIFEDSRGILWFATEMGLFQRKKGDNPLTDFQQDSAWGLLNKSKILCINEDRQGNLWIGTIFNGLYCQTMEYRGTTNFLHYTHDPLNNKSISNDNVWSIYEDVNNDLWIATEHGLNKYIREENYFIRYYNEVDLGANFIYDLTGDDKGYLWMATESGLIRFNPEVDPDSEKVTNRFKQILTYKDIYRYQMYKNNAGKIFVGGAYNSGKGYYSFYPDSLEDNTNIPPLVIINFKVKNIPHKSDTSISLKKHLCLKYNQNFFSFEFAALDYAQPEKNQYAYYLEGFEDDWIYTGHSRIANYTGVPPGKYIFHAKGSNNDGYWNEEGVSIIVTILPPPWKTWWAYTLYFLLFIGLIVAWRRYDLKRLRLKQQLEIEHIESGKLKELDSLKSKFFANISHEFRTPLTLILSPLEALLSKTSDPKSKQDLNIMQRNALRLQQLINQLLNLSKLESGQMKLQARKVNFVKLVNGYVQSFESLAKQKQIELVFHADKTEIPLYIDQEKLEKILYNLLSNAFKFTPEGGKIEVSVSKKSTFDNRQSTIDNVIISISDSGPGIPPDKLSHIFDRFYQVDDSSSRTHEGMGIGLALTKELVALHHGSISVESEEGHGTTFTMQLPVGKEHLKEEEILSRDKSTADIDQAYEELIVGEEIDHGPIKHQPNIQYQDSKPIILVVEDNTDLRDYIRGFLDESYQVMESGDGEAGLQQAIETVPDLIISDVMMPKMDGYQLCQKLKTDERTSHIPLILLTARAGTENRIEGLETGADDFITKPFDPHELTIRIKNLIDQRHRLRERFLKNADTIGLSRLMELPDSGIASTDQKFLKKAIGIVEKHLDDYEFSVEHLVRSMAVSQMQLYRKLKALVNLSANEFIRSIRLSHAAKLIKQKSGNIAQIAYAVGFNNPSYFAECFKKQFGVLPSEYHSDK